MYSVSLSDQAKAFFEEATADLQKRLDRCFDQIKLTPYRHSHIKPLKGKLAGYSQLGHATLSKSILTHILLRSRDFRNVFFTLPTWSHSCWSAIDGDTRFYPDTFSPGRGKTND